MEPTARIVRCPICRKTTKHTPANPHRPFCSQRCRTIDLGSWADESYKIPVKPSDSDWESLGELLEKQKNQENPDQ